MKNIATKSPSANWFRIFFFTMVCLFTTSVVFSQTANIVVDGTNVYVSENTKYPFWLAAAQTLAAGTNVTSVSVIEYRITATPSGENILQFVGPLKITSVQTVPAGKTWKVEAALLNPAVGVANNGWTDDGTVVRLTAITDNVGIGTASPTQKLDVHSKIAIQGKEAFDGTDGWLRLNQSAQFGNGIYSPGFLRTDGGIASGGLGSLGAGTVTATGVINSNVGYQISNGAISGNFLRGNGTNFVSSAIQPSDLSLVISGTTNTMAKFTGVNSIGNSLTTDDGTTVTTSGQYDITGGAGTSYTTAPIEIRTTLTPRVAFHWPGVVASQIGMDASGVIRTYNNPGTGYEQFAASNITANGIFNTSTGYRISNAATAGNYLRGDGTNFVSSAIQAGDLPGGNGSYIQNQYGGAQGANFFISGEAKISGWFRNTGGTGLYNESYGNHFYGIDANYWFSRSNRGIIIGNVAGTYRGYLYHDDGGNFGLLSQDGNWKVRVNNSEVEAYNTFYANTEYIRYTYDRDNTAYYLDLNGSSYANYFGRNQGFNWTEYDWNNNAYYVDPNNVSIFQDVRSSIFYDRDNTGYYIDMNNGSYTNYFGREYGWNWVEKDWNDGGYYTDLNGSSRVHYFGRNYGWNWTEYDWNDGQYYMDLHATSILNDLRSQIWYDYNNTGYYIDGNNGSNLNYATANDWYVNSWFRVNGGGGIYWQAYGGGWYMQDGTWIRAYNGKSVLNQIYSGSPCFRGDQAYSGAYGSEMYSYDYGYGPAMYAGGYTYCYTYYSYSTKEKKDNIVKFDKDDYSSSLAFMDKLDLNYYTFKDQTEYKKTHVGLIAEETPTTLTAPGKEGVSYTELAIFNTGAIKELKSKVEKLERATTINISDFGVEIIVAENLFVSFSEDFKSKLNGAQPIVTITASRFGAEMIVREVSQSGFTVAVNKAISQGISFNWIAMAKTTIAGEQNQTQINTRFADMIQSAENDTRPIPKLSEKPQAAKAMAIETSFDPAKFHEETKNKPATKIDPAEADKEGEKMMKKPDTKGPEETKITPPEETKTEIKQKAEDDLKKYVPVDESSPLKAEPRPAGENAGSPK